MRKIIVFVILLGVLGFQGNIHAGDFYRKNDTSGFQMLCPKLIGFSVVLATSFVLDEFVRTEVKELNGKYQGAYFDIANQFGGAKMIAFAPLLYGTGFLLKDERLKKTSCMAFNAFVISGAATQVLKYGFGRARPYNDFGAFYFNPLPAGFNDDFFSFPSGHSQTAWSLITPFAEEYSRWLYIIPVSVSLARIYKDRHWLSDVIMGGGLGYFSAWYMLNKPSKKLKIAGNGLVYYF